MVIFILNCLLLLPFLIFCTLESLLKLFIPKKRKSVTGEIVLITGAGHGIGRLTAYEFAKLKCKLVLWDINKHGIEETADECRRLGAKAHAFVVDCSKREDIYSSAKKVKAEIGDVSILVNNAGVVYTSDLFATQDPQIEKTFEVNILAHFWTTKAFLPAMMKNNHGHIVTVASAAGHTTVPFLMAYCSSKFAAVGFHRALTDELAALKSTGVKTSCLCPNFINTGFIKNPSTALGPTLEPEEVVNKLMKGILNTMFRLLSSLLLVALASGCGRPSFKPSTRVVNGEDAIPYSWPWQVSLQFEKNGTFHHTCGGSLIAPSWVMTAGHCVSSSLTYQVVLGEYDQSKKEGPEQVIPINAEDLFPHPLWDPSCAACGNDIALIKLSRPAQLGDTVKIACLPPADDILPNEAPCYISGWGRLSTNGPLSDKLQQALLPVVDHEHCTQKDWWGSSLKKTMLCAGGDIRSGCNGDSGGPLNCPAADGSWQVHGVTSFVSIFGCNALKKPTVFTRVSAFNDWIQEVFYCHEDQSDVSKS